MRSLRALTILLVLLVLLPAVALAWLGWRGADAWEEATRARIRLELADAEREIRGDVARASAGIEDGLRARVETLAKLAAVEVPARGIGPGMARVVSGVADGPAPRIAWIRLVASDGRTLWPVPWSTERPASSAPLDALLWDLRRRADRVRVADGDAAVVGYWGDVAARAHAPTLVALAKAEALCDSHPTLAALQAMEASFDDAEREAAGRPLTLALVDLALRRKDRAASCELRRRWDVGQIAAVPLTDAERESARLALFRCATGVAAPLPAGLDGPWTWSPWSQVPAERPAVEAPVRGGARLEAFVLPDELWGALATRIPARVGDAVHAEAWRWAASSVRAAPLWKEIEARTTPRLVLPGPLGVDGLVVFWHRDQDALRAGRTTRRTLTLAGIAALFLLMAIGLLVVRRAVGRERAARRLQDEFVSNVSHELRTPLASVLLHAEMLAEDDPGPSPGRRAARARVVRAEGARLAGLVEDLLDFSALERGARRLEPELVDLAQAVRAAAAPYATLAEAEGVELVVESPDGEVATFADPHALSRILANLLSNAWRHGRPSRDGAPGRIRVRVLDGPPDVTVEVEDDGPGIPPEERALVFERFRRGRDAGARPGAGLGLALARDLARSMEGDLALREDRPGTVFRLRLPWLPEGTA